MLKIIIETNKTENEIIKENIINNNLNNINHNIIFRNNYLSKKDYDKRSYKNNILNSKIASYSNNENIINLNKKEILSNKSENKNSSKNE